MSYVTGVTLIVDCLEDEKQLEDCLNIWYDNQGYDDARFSENLSKFYGGTKHPQQVIFGAGVNYLDKVSLLELLSNYKWENPAGVVLILQTEDEPAVIWRPEFKEKV